jgi:hypothetical protein
MVHKILLMLCAAVILFSIGCEKQAPQPDASADAAEGQSVSLFNGKDLTGWETTGNAKWSVQDGMLIGTQGENNAPGDIFTAADYSDFELNVTYRTEWPCNSGDTRQ